MTHEDEVQEAWDDFLKEQGCLVYIFATTFTKVMRFLRI